MTQKVVKTKISTASYNKNDSFSLAKNTREQIFNLASDAYFRTILKLACWSSFSCSKLIGKNKSN
jgi:hypothetical protein